MKVGKIQMENTKICPGCNKEIGSAIKFCPYCGSNVNGERPVALHQLQPNTVLNNRYRIGKVIGEGNFGITYLAEDTTLQMKVAVKEFYPKGYVTREHGNSSHVTIYEGSKSAHIAKWRDNFINEARNLAKLSGLPGIVEVRDYFDANGTAYIVMEFLDGDDLETYIEKNGYTGPNDAQYGLGKRISVEQTKKIMEPVFEALAKVHEAGMVHRDISPDNIKFNAKGGLKVFDFGAAREVDLFGTSEKTVMLKLGYAPEEQHRKTGNQGPWTDVYALCATFYKCITGIVPVDSMERIYQDTLKKPSELGIQISAYDEMALMMGLAIFADKRFSDMNALYKAFYQTGTNTNPAQQPVQQSGQTGARQSIQQSVQQPMQQQAPKKKSKKGLGLAIGVILSIAFLATAMFLAIKLDLFSEIKDMASGKGKNKTEATEGEDTEGVEGEEEDELIADLQKMMNDKDYEKLIEELLELDEDDLTEEQADTVDTLLPAAISAKISASNTSIDSLASTGNYEKAFTALEEEKKYCEELAKEEKASKHIDLQTFEDKYTSLIQGYQQYVANEANKCAAQADEAGVESIFAEAEKRLSEEAYKDAFQSLKEKTYSTLVMKVATKMNLNNDTSADIMTYIEKNVEKTGNNCWVLEFWDYFYAVYRMENNVPSWDSSVQHVSSSGFLLDYSDSKELTDSDLRNLTRYELQLARFEIYARHGRTFNDPSVTSYFKKYAWYRDTYGPENFDESVLSKTEKDNINFILQYEINKGYRSFR